MNGEPKRYLSKARFMEGIRCTKLLWYAFNRKEEIPELDEEALALIESGKEVGGYAQKLYPDGVKLEWTWNLRRNYEQTLPALGLRKPLFESAAIYDRAYAQADILVPADKGMWDIVEVKATSEVKHEHYIEVAFQKFVYGRAGIPIDRCYLMHINREYVRMGEIEPAKLFKKEDISEKVEELITGIEKEIGSMLNIAGGREEPETVIGSHCNSPYECPLKSLCWGSLPEGNVLTLRSDRKGVRYDLFNKGVLKLSEITDYRSLNREQQIQIDAEKSGKEHIDKEAINDFLAKLEYPLYFLDFETMNPAIPPYDMTSPFDFIMFEFSLHIIEREGEAPRHNSYISPGVVDPRPEMLEKLKALLGSSGRILAWYSTFEMNCLRQAGERYKEYSEWFEKIEGRFIDLLEPFRKLNYYSPKQHGSVSLKEVLPALTGKGYEGMEIGEGGKAMREYQRVTFDKNTSEEDRRAVYKALEEYCSMDTLAMIEILDELRKKVRD